LSLVLFDIDGTLLLSGGAGVRAMTRAFERVFGVADGFVGIPVAGHTDTFLLSQALDRANLPDTPDRHAEFRRVYLSMLAAEIHEPGAGRRGVMPGVDTLLAAISGESSFHAALLTGNYQQAAQIKLRHFGLAEFFAWGTFGEESPDRNELGRIAMTRAEERQVPAAARARAVVVGDTPHDIACARAAGARAVAVATGSYSEHELAAAGADVALPDLRDTERVLAMLR
jgi:phosphoglycolate phosphatase